MRISPDVFDSAARIACTIWSCSSLLRNSLVRIALPAGTGAAPTETATAATESSTASRRPSASSTAHRQEDGTASARGVAVTAESSHHSRNDNQDRDKDDEEQKTGCWGVAVSLRDSFPRSLVFAANRFEDRIDPFGQTAFVIVVPKMRFDPVFRDVERS